MTINARIVRIIGYGIYIYFIIILSKIALVVLPKTLMSLSDSVSQFSILIILISVGATFFISFFIPDIKINLDKILKLKKPISNCIGLWFDWIKWLALAGTITVVAEKTQDPIINYIRIISYALIFTYFLINFLNYLEKIGKWFNETCDWFNEKQSVEQIDQFAFKFFLLIIPLMMLGLIFSCLLLKAIINWNDALESLVTKLINDTI
jgi:hypothetical protein